jgi:hypothetical protein
MISKYAAVCLGALLFLHSARGHIAQPRAALDTAHTVAARVPRDAHKDAAAPWTPPPAARVVTARGARTERRRLQLGRHHVIGQTRGGIDSVNAAVGALEKG